ncbi:MAG: SMC-Scp complex subunit ScpB [Candidatus Altiarchaeales archaeon ex4484_96]|nr:MAG: SMC-Scp complex subunit ScpB [Candidatus Altiarchaeales archaeon ex4484_96]
MSEETKKIIEAALFIAGRPLALEDIQSACNLGNPGIIRKHLNELVQEYGAADKALLIEEVSGEYHMTVKPELENKIMHLAPEKEISSAALKTLALIAAEQPMKQSKVVKLRGNRAYRYIKELTEQGFIESKKHSRTKILSTTPRFQQYFNIKQLDELQTGGEKND